MLLIKIKINKESLKDKIKENTDKIKLNKQLPYLVSNIVEILEVEPEEGEQDDMSYLDLNTQVKGKCVVIKTSTRQVPIYNSLLFTIKNNRPCFFQLLV